MEQFNRVERYLKRIEAIYEGVPLSHSCDKQSYDDDVMSFFIHCYHVRDWLIHDDTLRITQNNVDEYIKDNRALSVCTDLANGLKHCRLTRNTRTEDQPHVSGSERLVSKFGDEPSIMSSKYRIMSNNQTLDALTLAKECVQLWRELFAKFSQLHNK
ncbi:MAG: hypothetical protein ACJAS1_006173 [Oleiphilaceae bacterium]